MSRTIFLAVIAQDLADTSHVAFLTIISTMDRAVASAHVRPTLVAVRKTTVVTELQLGESITDEAEATNTSGEAIRYGRGGRADDGGVDGRRGVHGLLSGLVERLRDGSEDPGDGGKVHGRRSSDDLIVECLGRRGWVGDGGTSFRLRAQRGDLRHGGASHSCAGKTRQSPHTSSTYTDRVVVIRMTEAAQKANAQSYLRTLGVSCCERWA
jgi:hypothetical protein